MQQTKGETRNALVHNDKKQINREQVLTQRNLRSFYGLLLDGIRFLDTAAKAMSDDGAAEHGHFRSPQAASTGSRVTAARWAVANTKTFLP